MPEDRKPPNFNRNPMLWLAAAFAAGILAGGLVNSDLRVLLPMCAVLAALTAILRNHTAASYAILFAFAAAGAVSIQIERISVAPDRIRVLYDSGAIRSGDPVEIEGVLTGRPEPSIDGVFLNLRSEAIKHRGSDRQVSGNVRLFLPQPESRNTESDVKFDVSDLKYGSRIRVACQLTREDAFLNPGVMPRKKMLDRLGVDATGSVKSALLIEKIADESVFLPLAWVYDQRAKLLDDFRRNLSPSAAGVMNASLLGDKYFLDKDTSDLFREGGTFHILVISGLHITFIGGLLLLFVRQVTRNRWIQFIVTNSVLWAYTLAVGADVPVVRAAIMFTVILYSYVIYRQASLVNSLGVCALILLVWRPSDIFNPSFQLTFVSVAAILAMAYPLIESLRNIGSWTPTPKNPFPPNVPAWLRSFCELLYWREEAWKIEAKRQIWTAKLFKSPLLSNGVRGIAQKTARYVFEGILVSVIVQIWMLPLLVVYFHRVSVASIVLNLWVGFFIAFESFAAVAGAVANQMSVLLAAPFFATAELFNWLMLAVPRLFAGAGWASFRLPAYSGTDRMIYILYFFPVLLIAFAVYRWNPFELRHQSFMVQKTVLYPVFAALIAFTGFIVFHPFSSPRPDGRLHIDFLDVGQGDSALVTFPDGKTLLIDGGGRINYGDRDREESEAFEPDVRGIGEAVVSEFLWHRGYSRLDHILATHADADHIQGLTDVAKNFSIGSAIFGRTPMDDPDFAGLADVLKRRGILVETINGGDRLLFGETVVEVLYPPASSDVIAASDNDNSVVLRITYGSRAFLLTGDIEKNAEAAIVSGGGTLSADLLKVAHHGSRTSSTEPFIDAAGAGYAVISVGRSSPFGHPHPEVVERLRAAGAKVITTGERGTVSFSTNGNDLVVETFQP